VCFATEKRTLPRHAVRQLMPFASTYLWENGFKISQQHKESTGTENAAPDLRIKLPCIKLNVKGIYEYKKHISH
jgi:hypothetical protein